MNSLFCVKSISISLKSYIFLTYLYHILLLLNQTFYLDRLFIIFAIITYLFLLLFYSSPLLRIYSICERVHIQNDLEF